MKEGICTAVGVVGSAIAAAFGGWDQALVTLVIFMVIDYLSGLIVAGIFHNSRKNRKRSVGKQSRMEGAVQKRCDIAVCVDRIPSGSCTGCKLYSQCSDHWIHGK